MSLVSVDTTSALAVTDYLTKARDWMDSAISTSTPSGIGQAKIELSMAAEATKQLGLSKEIQSDATEMVRRAEFVLRKSVALAQENGEIKARGADLIPGARTGSHVRTASSDLPSPKDFFASQSEYEDANAMAALDEAEFAAVLSDAKAEGNLSRANVVRKAREKSGSPKPSSDRTERAHQEAELINSFGSLVRRALTPKNVATLTPTARERLIQVLENALDILKESA